MSQVLEETKGADRVHPHVWRYACVMVCAALLSGCGRDDGATSQTGHDPGSVSVHSWPPGAYTDGQNVGRTAADAMVNGDSDNPFHLVGAVPEVWSLDQWADGEAISWNELRGKVVVVRFFELDSEPCRRTMQAMQQLHEEFRDCPVMFVGVLRTTRRDRGPAWNDVVRQVRQRGITFPIARDNRGVTLEQWWLRYFENVPRTPTFVIGPDGRIAHVQPGPEFHPNDDLMFALCDRDFRDIRLAIQVALPQDVALRVGKSS